MKTLSCRFAGRERLASRSMSTRSSTHAGGFTLIEVVIALAIFVVGALAIVRIFPPALGVIQNAGDRTTASNLSRDNLASLTSEPGLTPDAVYDEQYNSVGVYNDYPGAIVGSISKNSSLPRSRNEEDITGADGVQDTTGTALGHFRRIVGERHTVLKDAANNKYILTRYPYVRDVNPDTTGTDNNKANAYPNRKPIEIYVEDRVNGVRVDRQGYLDFREARLASDNSSFFDTDPATPLPGGDPRRPPSSMRGVNGVTYYVSYRYRKNVNGPLRMQGVTDEPLFFRENSIAFPPVGTTPISPVNTEQVFQGRAAQNNSVIAGNVDVRFTRRVAIGAAPTLPPANATLPLMDEDASYRGFFHLLTADAGVVAGQTVMVNYSVRDWRWMVDDAAPAQTPVDEKFAGTFGVDDKTRTLPIRYLNDENTIPREQAPTALPNYVYSLLTYNPAGVGTAPPNAEITRFENTGEWNGNSTAPARLRHVNPKLSQVTYNLNGNLVAPRVRTVYWTLDGWAVQPTVAARDYVPHDNGRSAADPLASARSTVEQEPWREYFWPSSPTSSGSPNVYFHWGDAGKTVEITYQYVGDADDPVKIKTATGTFTINDRDEPFPSAYPTDSGFAPNGRVVAVTLSDPAGEPFVDASAKQVVGILAVRGLSVRARTAWMDNGRYTQAVAAGYRP